MPDAAERPVAIEVLQNAPSETHWMAQYQGSWDVSPGNVQAGALGLGACEAYVADEARAGRRVQTVLWLGQAEEVAREFRIWARRRPDGRIRHHPWRWSGVVAGGSLEVTHIQEPRQSEGYARDTTVVVLGETARALVSPEECWWLAARLRCVDTRWRRLIWPHGSRWAVPEDLLEPLEQVLDRMRRGIRRGVPREEGQDESDPLPPLEEAELDETRTCCGQTFARFSGKGSYWAHVKAKHQRDHRTSGSEHTPSGNLRGEETR